MVRRRTMYARRSFLAVAVVLIAVLTVLPMAACARKPVGSVTRVLFIGNSFTDRNGGLDTQLMRLAPSVEASRVTRAGFSLQSHWFDGSALAAIRSQRWDYVVLQEQSVSAVLAQPAFFLYARAFEREIRRTGARTILLETWERPDMVSSGVTAPAIAESYRLLGDSIGSEVASAGVAFADSIRERPDLQLNLTDGHPTVDGTYLAGCVMYGTIFARTPVGNVAADPAVPAEVQVFLQKVAAQAVGR